jgi:hypothetical protein
MVVMEYLDNSYEMLYTPSEMTLPVALRSQLRAAVHTLHEGGFVHGDIRDVNFMFSKVKRAQFRVMILDFDWAGVEGKALYPENVNTFSVRRPDGVTDGKLITKEHDLCMLDWITAR